MDEDTTRRGPDDPSGQSATTERSADNLRTAAANAGNAVANAAGGIGESAANAAETARDKAGEFAERGKAAGAGRMEGFARAARRAADDLQEDSPQIAGYVRQAADGLQQASSSIRSRSVGEIMDMVEDFARRQPTAYFSGAVLAGFVLSRFVKSRPDRSRRYPGAHTSWQASRRRQDPAPNAGMPSAKRDDLPSTPSSIGEIP
ncbi:hypothetical protein SAZ10_02180 [Mesorhizobium sp. BAC0120]|uniref:hypothetical protein n=1 Tax=Mesorhizobium sp. BAC0120 TaxID=3090670 RepID=UPI00298BEEE0|nr:hypothetical protein [Mesorhizobium sp. BAC0120]MDW6020564.1 hypothetical protein [Mesorhizobium sp. BAC0120]